MKKKPRANRAVTIITILICFALVFAVIWAIVTGVRKIMHYGEATTIESTLTEEDPVMTPPLPTDKEAPEDQLPSNRYNADGFYEIDGIRFYFGSDYIGVPGVDVSSYQSDIDWEAVKEAGIEFAVVRVGYRGYGSGKLDLDNCFHEHLEGAIAAGLDVGVYFFSQALNPEEAIEEAEFVLEMIEPYELQYPVVFDWEEVPAEARTDEMNMLLLTSCAEAFCQTIEDAGYEAGIYFNQSYGYGQLNLSSLSDYDFWLAEYAEAPSFAHHFHMWQYTNEGIVPGIKEQVDLNISFEKSPES